MSHADLEKWEARYAGRDADGPGPVDPFLREIESEFPKSGRALDLAIELWDRETAFFVGIELF